MMTVKQAVGAVLISLPFIWIFLIVWRVSGLEVALTSFGVTFVIILVISLGVVLLED